MLMNITKVEFFASNNNFSTLGSYAYFLLILPKTIFCQNFCKRIWPCASKCKRQTRRKFDWQSLSSKSSIAQRQIILNLVKYRTCLVNKIYNYLKISKSRSVTILVDLTVDERNEIDLEWQYLALNTCYSCFTFDLNVFLVP